MSVAVRDKTNGTWGFGREASLVWTVLVGKPQDGNDEEYVRSDVLVEKQRTQSISTVWAIHRTSEVLIGENRSLQMRTILHLWTFWDKMRHHSRSMRHT